ncbi:hypothetical protein J3B02_001871 [Coemansia erecta]|nr:hypothetical protein J3B02_001871 [Coemansia erecta]
MDHLPDTPSDSDHIAGLAQQIASLTQQVAGLTQQIAGQAQQKAGNDQQIAGLLQQIAGQAQQISTMQSRISALEMQNAALGGSTSLPPQQSALAHMTPNRSLVPLSIDVAAGSYNGIATPLNTSVFEDGEMQAAQGTKTASATVAAAAAAAANKHNPSQSQPENNPGNRTRASSVRKESKLADDDISLFPDDSIMDVLQPERRQRSNGAASAENSHLSPASRRSQVHRRYSRSPSATNRSYKSRYRSRFGHSRSRSRTQNYGYSRGRSRSRSRSRDRRNSYGYAQSSSFGYRRADSGRDLSRNANERDEFGRDRTRTHNRKMTNASGDSHKDDNSEWLVVDLACTDKRTSHFGQDPVMPTSVKQLSGEKTTLTSYDKVCAWKQESAEDAKLDHDNGKWSSSERLSLSPKELQKLRKPSQSQSGNSVFVIDTSRDDSLGKKAVEKSASPAARLSSPYGIDAGSFTDKSNTNSHDDDGDDDDTDNPLSMLRSKSFSSRSTLQLTDSSGLAVTSDRLSMLWSVCAWLPLDCLDTYYEKMFKTNLYSNNSKSQIKGFIRGLEQFAERKVSISLSYQILIFKSGSHLKRLSNNQQIFVWSPVPEPVLFFYLVTTVLQPLGIHQGDTIVKLWKDEFGGTPVGLTTVKDPLGAGWTKWEDIRTLWNAAINWLCSLAYQVTNLGKPYLIKKLTNWDGKVSNICANAQQRFSSIGGQQGSADEHQQQCGTECERPFEQQQQQRIRTSSLLGIGRPLVTSKRTRRYHSIAILTESTPLMMEQGEEFFAPPPRPCRNQRTRKGSRDNKADGSVAVGSMGVREKERRNFTAPSFARALGLQALAEVEVEAEVENGSGSTRASSGGSTVCSRAAGCKTVAELAQEWEHAAAGGAEKQRRGEGVKQQNIR